MRKEYHHSIVCDIDDTISFTTNRDWENATPNKELIKKINHLYDAGWHISLYTARGSLSCKSREDADKKYRPIIEKWMCQNGVKYHILSFNKPLATYYIDDKAIRPCEFIELDIKILQGGQSGSIVEKRGNRVYKTARNSLDSAYWYRLAENYMFKVPKIYSLIGETLCMEYIEDNSSKKLHTIFDILNVFKNITQKSPEFDTYLNRIQSHLELFPYKIEGLTKNLKLSESFFNNERTFCHGDFTIDNILVNNDKHYLIDPIYLPDIWSSWLLDVSKFAHSCRRFGEYDMYKSVYECFSAIKPQLQLLEIAQWIRIRKYSNETLKSQTDKEIENLIREFNETRSSAYTEIKIGK